MRRLVPYLFVSLYAFGQQQPPPPVGSSSIRGTARNAVTGEPIGNVLVTLQGGPKVPNVDGWSLTKSTISGTSGEFHFNGLPPGSYECRARKFDFIGLLVATIDLPQSETAEGLIQFELTPYGVIKGTVVDQFGEPAEYVSVIIDAANPAHAEIGRLRTNHRGGFSLTRIPPGRYFVRVAGRDGGTETVVGPEKDHYATWDSFVTTYLDGSHERALAQPVEVAAGAVVQANFRVDLQPAVRIRGKLEGYRQDQPVEFQLLQGDERGEPQRAVLDTATGEFQLVEVLPGTYTLRATQGDTRGEMSLSVGETNSDVIAIALAPGVNIKGTTHVIDANMQHRAAERAACTTRLHEYRRREYGLFSVQTTSNEFLIQGVFPGEYRVEFHCSGGYPISASFGGIDLMTNRIITVGTALAPSIDLTLGQGGGTLKVSVSGEAKSEAVDLFLTPLFPTLLEIQVRSVWQSVADMTVFEGLPAGDYRLYAVPLSNDVDFQSAAFIQSLSGGVLVRIEDGKPTEVSIEGISR